MKKIILLCVLLVYGCSSGGDSSPTAPTLGNAPSISSLSYSPKSASVGQGGGSITVSGSFDCIDLDGDVTTLKISSDGITIDGPIAWDSNLKVDTVVFAVVGADTTIPETSTFQVWVVDSKGNASNKLTGTFTVS